MKYLLSFDFKIFTLQLVSSFNIFHNFILKNFICATTNSNLFQYYYVMHPSLTPCLNHNLCLINMIIYNIKYINLIWNKNFPLQDSCFVGCLDVLLDKFNVHRI